MLQHVTDGPHLSAARLEQPMGAAGGGPWRLEGEASLTTDAQLLKLRAASKPMLRLPCSEALRDEIRAWRKPESAKLASKTAGSERIPPGAALALTLALSRRGTSARKHGALPGSATGLVSNCYSAIRRAMRPRMDFPLGGAEALDDIAAELQGGRRLANRVRSSMRNPLKCVGALDGAAISVAKPSYRSGPAASRFARKPKTHAMLIQVLLNAKHEAMHAAHAAAAVAGDSASCMLPKLRIGLESACCARWADCKSFWIAADAACGLRWRALAPWAAKASGSLSDADCIARDALNFYQSSARMASEQGFGMLKPRLPMLGAVIPLEMGSAASCAFALMLARSFAARCAASPQCMR